MKNIILFGGSEYERYSEPAPEIISQNYLIEFKELLKLNVHTGEHAEVKYENGREIGFTVFIDEKDIRDLPIDWQKVERWTEEEEKSYRERKEEEEKAIEETDRIWRKMMQRRSGREGL